MWKKRIPFQQINYETKSIKILLLQRLIEFSEGNFDLSVLIFAKHLICLFFFQQYRLPLILSRLIYLCLTFNCHFNDHKLSIVHGILWTLHAPMASIRKFLCAFNVCACELFVYIFFLLVCNGISGPFNTLVLLLNANTESLNVCHTSLISPCVRCIFFFKLVLNVTHLALPYLPVIWVNTATTSHTFAQNFVRYLLFFRLVL